PDCRQTTWPHSFCTLPSFTWLKLQAGLRLLWQIAMQRNDSKLFNKVFFNARGNCAMPQAATAGIEGLSPALADLCDLNRYSNAQNSPYHTAVYHISWLLPIKCSTGTMLNFMIFPGSLPESFKALLELSDPRALALMALWYTKVSNSTWWMSPRAAADFDAIYQYLLVVHPSEHKLLGMLRLAKQIATQDGLSGNI
ncbi:hypothetical protein LTR66_017839, partial [Elasticomyces elasticus]